MTPPVHPCVTGPLPALPEIAVRLLELRARGHAEISAAGCLIGAHPDFAERVLQTANSALFSLEKRVGKLSHAIVLLGSRRVRAIALTRALADFAGAALHPPALRLCWQNMLAGALLAGKVARVCKMDVDDGYVAGLLRDVGRLAMLAAYPRQYPALLTPADGQASLRARECAAYGVDHCQAGASILAGLAADLSEVAAHHHDPVGTGEFGLLELVCVADRLADALGFGLCAQPPQSDLSAILAPLPEPARWRLAAQPAELRLEIATRIQSWG